MADSKIEWTDTTWNPVVGCARVSAGCEHCYAETMAARHVLMSQAQGRKSPYLPVVDVERRRWNRKAVFLPERLGDPLRWRKPRRVFVNSMSDLFHEDISFEQIAAVFGVMAAAPQHTFQVLTKRPARMLEFFRWLGNNGRAMIAEAAHDQVPCFSWEESDDFSGPWPLPNVHLGVSVEDQRAADERIPVLLECPAALRFLSVEPLLGAVDLWPSFSIVDSNGEPSGPRCNADGSPAIGWVIVGGESGPGARPCKGDWIRSIVAQCGEAGVPVFVKQLGARWAQTLSNTSNPDRKGGDPDEWPEDLRVRQLPGGAP